MKTKKAVVTRRAIARKAIALVTIALVLGIASCDSNTYMDLAESKKDAFLTGTVAISPSDGAKPGDWLTAAYSGSENVSYQWYKDGAAIAGATGRTYNTTEAGNYTVTVSAAGFKSITSASVSVVTPTDTGDGGSGGGTGGGGGGTPVFVDVTGITLTAATTVTVGTALNLTATVAPGNATRQTIVWSIVSDGSTGTAISGSALAIGATAGTVKVKAAISGGASGGAADFTVEFDITTNNKVNAQAPDTNTVTTNPSPATVREDETLTMTSDATSPDGGALTYQWWESTDGTAYTSLGSAGGADTVTYTRPAGSAGTYYYYCAVTNTISDNGDGGVKSVTSESAAVTVTVNALPRHTVTFNGNGAATTPAAISGIASGDTISDPATGLVWSATPADNVFLGWWDSGYSSQYSFPLAISADITLYAKWKFTAAAVAYNRDDFPGAAASAITPKTIAAGDNLQTYLTGIAGTSGNYVIDLTGSPAAFTGSSGVNLQNGVRVSLRGTGTIDASAVVPSDLLFTLQTGAELIIRGPTLQGNSTIASNCLVYVPGGALTLHTGTITGNYVTGSHGGGVNVRGGTFIMTGGTISGNTALNGGGVAVNGGTFTMTGGTISGNKATVGGGVFVDSSTFIKTGGTIYGDTDAVHTSGADENTAASAASGQGHAVYYYGGGGPPNKYRDSDAEPGIGLDTGNSTNWGL